MVPPRKKPRSEGALGPGSEALDRGEAEEILKELGSQPISAPRPRPNPSGVSFGATGNPLENSERLALKDILNENQSSINGDKWGIFMNFRGMMSPWTAGTEETLARRIRCQTDHYWIIWVGPNLSKNGGRP